MRKVRTEYHLETSRPYLYRETSQGKEYRVAWRRVPVAIPSHPTTPWSWATLPGLAVGGGYIYANLITKAQAGHWDPIWGWQGNANCEPLDSIRRHYHRHRGFLWPLRYLLPK